MTLRTIRGLSQETSRVVVLRGRLKHSWLENELLNKTAGTIIELRRQAGWSALRRFPSKAEQAFALAGDVEPGFSPARLVDECAPLASISEEQRSIIRKAVHAAYLECFDVHAAARQLEVSAADTRKALFCFLDEWDKPDEAVSEAELTSRWNAVLRVAERLRAALDALPKGIVLP